VGCVFVVTEDLYVDSTVEYRHIMNGFSNLDETYRDYSLTGPYRWPD